MRRFFDSAVFWVAMGGAIAAIGGVFLGVGSMRTSSQASVWSDGWFVAGIAVVGGGALALLWGLVLYLAHSHVGQHERLQPRLPVAAPATVLTDPTPDWEGLDNARVQRYQQNRGLFLVLVHNLRCALDYLAYELVALNNDGIYDEGTQFPIATDPAADESAYGRRGWRTLQLLRPQRPLIDQAQPYHDPENIYAAALGVLQALSNSDKHRLLVPAAVAADFATMALVYPGSGVSRSAPTSYKVGVITPGEVIAIETFQVTEDHPTVTLTPLYEPLICFHEWPSIRANEALLGIHRRIDDLVQHFVPLF